MTGSPPSFEDYLAIRFTLARYCDLLDNKDWSLLAQTFSEDARVTFGEAPAIVGHDAIRAALNIRNGLDVTQHVIGNETISIEGERANSTCRVLGHLVLDGRVLHFGGVYEDELVKVGDDWQISTRRYVETWSDGDQAILAEAAERAESS